MKWEFILLRQQLFLFLSALLLLIHSEAFAVGEVPRTITLDGRLFSNAALSTPLLDASASLQIEVLNPAKDCVIYQETKSVNTTTSDGYFSVSVGAPSMVTGFSNASVIAPGTAGCMPGYTPSAGDKRFIRVTVTPTAGSPEVLTPDLTVESVPSAFVAESVQGLNRSKLLELGTNVELTQANIENVFSVSNYPKLTSLLSGSTTDYVRRGANGSALAPTIAGNASTPAAGQFWYDTSANVLKYYDGTTVQTLGGAVAATTSGTIGGTTVVNTSGNITTSGTISGNQISALSVTLYDSDRTNSITLQTPATGLLTSNYSLTFPVDDGTSGQVLSTNGSGGLSWANASSGLPSGTDGQFLRYTSGSWGGARINITDIRSSLGMNPAVFPAACTTSQTLRYDVMTDTFACADINLAGAGVANGILPVANGGTGTSTGSITGTGALMFAAGGANQNVVLTPSGTGTSALGSKVGIGTTSATAPLSIVVPEATSSRETFQTFRVASDTNSVGGFVNGTAADNVLTPTFFAYRGGSMDRHVAAIRGVTNAAGDTALVENALVDISGFVSDNAVDPMNGNLVNPANRNLFSVSNWDGPLVVVGATGRLGVGTNAPSAKLDVRGTNGTTLKIIDGNQGAGKVLTSDANGVASWATAPGAGSGQWNTGTASSINYIAGNVAIGTTTASAKLDVSGGGSDVIARILSGGTTNSAALRLGRTAEEGTLAVAGAAGLWSAAAGPGDLVLRTESSKMLFDTNFGSGTPSLTILGGNGNVGIGTTTPAYKLDVNGSVNATSFYLNGNPFLPGAAGTTSSSVASTGGQVSLIRQSDTAAASASRSALTLRNDGTGGAFEYNLMGLNAGGAVTSFIRQDGSARFDTWTQTPTIYGSNVASGTLTLQSTSDATKGHVLINPAGGNVGVGTTSPGTLLHLAGSSPYITFDNTGGSNNRRYRMGPWDGTGNFYLYDQSAGIDRFVVTTGGNFGVNTVTPQSRLDVNGGISVGSYGGVNAAPSNGMIVSGNVGIATTTPGTTLDVNGGIRAGASTVVTATCNSSNEGIQRYNYSAHAMEYCNGTSWVQLVRQTAGTTVPVVAMGPPVGANIYAISSATANYTPGFGDVAKTWDGTWIAAGTSGTSNTQCVQLRVYSAAGHHIVYDLGSNRSIGTIHISSLGQPYNFMRPYVAFSLDNVTYATSVEVVMPNTQSVQYASITLGTPVTARYLRVTNGGYNDSDPAQSTFCDIAVGP